MDILNFISWIKGGRQVTTVDASKTLIPLGLKDNRRDDGYLAGAITVEDFAAQLTPPAPEPTYKVYTALLTQSGVDNLVVLNSGLLTIGVTYQINENDEVDFTNVGAPNNNTGTYFVATNTTPNSWGTGESVNDILITNTGAPVVTVLENTIGNIWFTYGTPGTYYVNSNGLFTDNKTVIPNGSFLQNSDAPIMNMPFFQLGIQNTEGIYLSVSTHPDGFNMDGLPVDDILNNTPIEIRVYN